MKNRYTILLIAALAFGLVGCDHSGDDPYTEQAVLQGALYVGYPPSIRLVHTVPIDQPYDSRDVGISGATVVLGSRDQWWLMVEQPPDSNGAGYYSLPADTLVVQPNTPYWIEAAGDGFRLEAQTVSVGSTRFTYQSKDTVEYGETELILSWSPDTLSYGYAFSFDNLEPDWADRAVSGNNGQDVWSPVSVWGTYRGDTTMVVAWVALQWTGRHRVRIFSCDRAYWDYIMTYGPGQVENYPRSNVTGGLGVFCAVGVDTAYFVLTDSISDGPGVGG
jgi:hypothetical protein